MKDAIKQLMDIYNTNTYVHSFVLAIEAAVISFVTSYNGGLPANKAAWVSFACGIGGAIWGAFKRWMQTNVATTSTTLKVTA